MKNVKWFFVVLLLSSLTSFVAKDQPTGGLNVGDIAPDFRLQTNDAEQPVQSLREKRGHLVLLSFWASYDAVSRLQNASLGYAVSQSPQNVEMVSISFDEYESTFLEAIRNDELVGNNCYREQRGVKSSLYQTYRLKRGFSNYLIDADGVIIAKNINPKEFLSYLN